MPTNPIRLLSDLPRVVRAIPRLAPDMATFPDERIITVDDGFTTRVFDTGEEHLQPLVLAHGMVATGLLNWYQVFERLQGEFRLIAFDQRWHGKGYRSEEFRFVDLADDMFRVCDALELERPIIGGYSMGGIVCQLAAHRDQSRFRGMVLAATGTGAERSRMEKVTMGNWSRRHGTFVTATPGVVEATAEKAAAGVHRWALRELATVSMGTNQRVIAEVARFNSVAWLPEITIPVGIVKTLHDIAFPQKIQDEMADLLAHSAVFPIDAGHAVCATHPGTFARRMRTAAEWVVSAS